MDSIFQEILNLIKSRWHKKSTLLILILFTSGILLWMFSVFNFQNIDERQLWSGGLLLTFLILYWYYSNRIPKAPKGKIGFALGIISNNPSQQQQLKRDFTNTLRELLNKRKYKYGFAFIEIPNRFIEEITSIDIATKTLHDTRCSFIVYGKARTTTINGEAQHVLNLEGAVLHEPVPNDIRKSLSREFSELFPRRMLISQEGDLFQFEVTAQWVDIVSKYIIGIASLLSRGINYAQELFEDLQMVFANKQSNIPAFIKIKQRLPHRLEEIYVVQIIKLYEEWKFSKSDNSVNKIKWYLDKLDVIAPHNFEAKFYKSLFYFIKNRDISKAKTEIWKARHKKHTTWQYNYAFLLAYEGNTHEAVKNYKIAVQEVFEQPKVILEIVEFIMWVIDTEPDKIQLHFCLGYIYYFAIKDYALALQCFERFLEVTPNTRFSVQRKDAEKLILQIQKDIKSGKINFES